MVQIYYCIDINGWYIDKDDGVIRPDRDPFKNEINAINFFLKYIDCFLQNQKEMTLKYGQKRWSELNYCVLETTNFIYHVNADGTYLCRVKSE